MSFTELFIAFVMALIILMYIKSYYGEVVFATSDVDGRRYLVRKLPDRQDAADMIGRLNEKLTRLVQRVKAGGTRIDAADAKRLYDNFDPDAVSEGGTEIGYTSYSVNKGERIVMCLRHKDNSFVDENVLVYVAVHELGHLMTDEIGHTDRFWANFKLLLQQAIDLGLYTRVDFAASPESYCGIHITSSVV
jgi:hypothetical protein